MSLTIERTHTTPAWADRVQYPYPDQYIAVDGGNMHYVDVGHGEPIVFLHGLPTWSFIYRHMIRGLATDYRCIAPDMIGFGLSDKPANWSYSPMDQARNLTQLINQLQLENVTLVVHDYGAPIGLSYAVEHPENIKRIIVSNGFCWDLAGDPGAERIGRIAAGACGHLLLETMNSWPKIVRRSFADRSTYTETFERAMAGPTEKKEDRHGLWATAKNLVASSSYFEDIWHHRSEIDAIPFLLLWGMNDPSFGEKCLNKWWQAFPLAEVVKMQNVGHFPMEEKPAEVLRTVRDFMTLSRRGVGAFVS